MGQFEREYREALDGLRFSEEGKERIMNNLMEQESGLSVKVKRLRPLRAALIAAALCLALAGTAFAAAAAARQTKTHYLNTEDDKREMLERELVKEGDSVAISGGYAGQEYKSYADKTEDWWNAYGSMPIIGEVMGAEEDGWTKMRMFQREDGSLQMRYLAERLSGFNSLWMSTPWDVAWLEERYTAVPNTQVACVTTETEGVEISLGGEFQGEDGAAFRISARKDIWPHSDTAYQMTSGYDYTELYQTKDGVEVAVMIAASPSGKSVFWAELAAGCNDFTMYGTQLETGEIHDILDSLSLSNLLEYQSE